MRVAVVDVGANTLRLLAADVSARGVEPLREERRRTGLGEDVERFGHLTDEKIERSVQAATREVRRARKLSCANVEVLVTSPARNASNGDQLVHALAAAGAPVRALSADEEAGLAFAGAVACSAIDASTVAVCDVGGGSAQIAVGTPAGPAWMRSVPVGSLRLTERCVVSDPPTEGELARLRDAAAAALSGLTPPLPVAALATGGTARALRRLTAEALDEGAFEQALAELAPLTIRKRAERLGVDRERARTLLAGAIVLAELQRRLRVPLEVARGGLREGACLALARAEAASA